MTNSDLRPYSPEGRYKTGSPLQKVHYYRDSGVLPPADTVHKHIDTIPCIFSVYEFAVVTPGTTARTKATVGFSANLAQMPFAAAPLLALIVLRAAATLEVPRFPRVFALAALKVSLCCVHAPIILRCAWKATIPP